MQKIAQPPCQVFYEREIDFGVKLREMLYEPTEDRSQRKKFGTSKGLVIFGKLSKTLCVKLEFAKDIVFI